MFCLFATVVVSGLLDKLSHGAILGKSFNLPFTVVMFFFGYVMASYSAAQEADSEESGVALSVFVESIVSWKGAHPHVSLPNMCTRRCCTKIGRY